MDHFEVSETWNRGYYETIPAQDDFEEENPE
jgi:hypothetical protein